MDQLLATVIAKLSELNDVGGSSPVRLSNQLAPKGSVSAKDVSKALEKGLKAGAVVCESGKWHVTGRTPPAPPTVKVEDLSEGAGAAAAPGDTLTLRYEGRLLEGGAVFDAAAKFSFELGAGEVIKGWDTGAVGLRVGGTRRLTIPPQLGYGKRGSPPDIPPNAALVFDLTLLSKK